MPAPAAALAGVPAGMQAHGIWAGRRQLLVKFAGEAETATLYTAEGLASELRRSIARTHSHSICLTGRDVLGNVDYIAAVFDSWQPPLPVMLDTDGQRPDALQRLKGKLQMVQVSIDFVGPDALVDRALTTISTAAKLGFDHALVLAPVDETSDGQILRVVEKLSALSKEASVIIHPHPVGEPGTLDRRWAMLLEQAAILHDNVRAILRLPPPAGVR